MVRQFNQHDSAVCPNMVRQFGQIWFDNSVWCYGFLFPKKKVQLCALSQYIVVSFIPNVKILPTYITIFDLAVWNSFILLLPWFIIFKEHVFITCIRKVNHIFLFIINIVGISNIEEKVFTLYFWIYSFIPTWIWFLEAMRLSSRFIMLGCLVLRESYVGEWKLFSCATSFNFKYQLKLFFTLWKSFIYICRKSQYKISCGLQIFCFQNVKNLRMS